MLEAPWYANDVNNFGFTMYAAAQQAIEDYINALARSYDPNDLDIQNEEAERAGITLNALSNSEIEYIEIEVAKRRNVNY